jgi:catechol 2,3-dioxygenase-like lactoylglutathione lyase family enzyme
MSNPITSAWKVIPALKSRSIQATIDFYVGVLGFTLGGTFSSSSSSSGTSELTFCSVFAGQKAAANLYFFKEASEGQSFTPGSVLIALGTDELDEFWGVLKMKLSGAWKAVEGKVRIVEDIRDMPWGWRQFSILDPDDNKVTFFKFLEGGNPGTE